VTSYSFLQPRVYILRNVFTKYSPKSKHLQATYVYWTVQHGDSWRIKDQLDVTYYFISLLMCSTCFGHLYIHHEELATMLLNYHIGHFVLGLLFVGDLVRLGLSSTCVAGFSLQHRYYSNPNKIVSDIKLVFYSSTIYKKCLLIFGSFIVLLQSQPFLMLYHKTSHSIKFIGYIIIFSTTDFGLSYCLIIFLWSSDPSYIHTDDAKQFCANYIIIYFVSYLSGDDFLLSRNVLH